MRPNQPYDEVKHNYQQNQIPISNNEFHNNNLSENNYQGQVKNPDSYQQNMNEQPPINYPQQNRNNPQQNMNYPPQGMSYPQQNTAFPPQNYAVGQPIKNIVTAGVPAYETIFMPKSGFDKLMIPGIFVKQKFELLEVLTGCETENKYTVYACDVAGNKEGIPLFKCKEKSGFFNRNCLPGDCRRFGMEVTHDSGGQLSLDGLPFLKMERPFACTFLCLNRPFIEVNYSENGLNSYLGKVVNDFSCCEMFFTVFDKTNNPVYQIRGTIWQIGVYRQQNNCAVCKSCQQAFLFILDLRQGGRKVGIIEKRGKGFTELISDADNFSLLFPIKATAEERVLIMAACLLLDFRYFETMGGGGNRNRNRYY